MSLKSGTDMVVPRYSGSLIAVRESGGNRHLAVAYHEVCDDDGFVITAYFTSKVDARKAMESELMTSVADNVFGAMLYLLQLSPRRLWIDDDEADDVLHISLERPQRATGSELSEEGILYRHRDDKLVGLTVLDATAHLAIGGS